MDEFEVYVETDFILALIKDDDWLRNRAEAVFEEYRADLWTSRDTLSKQPLPAHSLSVAR
jgi:hypothetical protein